MQRAVADQRGLWTSVSIPVRIVVMVACVVLIGLTVPLVQDWYRSGNPVKVVLAFAVPMTLGFTAVTFRTKGWTAAKDRWRHRGRPDRT